MQKMVDEVRGKGAQLVVVLSHNGMDVDLKMASRVSGIDAILGGHTHDAVPAPSVIKNRSGQTLVINSGCNGKFLSLLDLDVKDGNARLPLQTAAGVRQPACTRPGNGRLHRKGTSAVPGKA